MDSGRKRELEAKVLAGERLDYDDGVALYASDDLAWLGDLAHHVRTAKNGDRVTRVHDLPDDRTALKKIRSAHHPDRNHGADLDLYQAVVEKLDRMRTVSLAEA